MGNASSSKERQEDTVDYGAFAPVGVYTGPQDWNHSIVTQLIIERKLAPFYRPLEDYDPSWDDERILANRKELQAESTPPPTAAADGSAVQAHLPHPQPTTSHHKHSKHHPRSASGKDPQKFSEALIYRGAVECPICFLYYPPNINKSRCCDQAICTECFVQIKRAEPTTTHLVSEPAECPYCVQDNFGVTYQPPPWRAGIGGENTPAIPSRPELSKANSMSSADTSSSRGKRRSISHTSKEVVTIDHIRPDWEAKLAAVRAAVTRRANRRIIMRQVGDRLIPVGITSGRVHALPPEAVADPTNPAIVEDPRRPPRRGRNQDLSQFLGTMGLAGQDLEDLMVMEAMRLSLIDHEEHQRREAAARNNAQASEVEPSTTPSTSAIPIPTTPVHASHPGTPSSVPRSTALPPSLPSTPSTPSHMPSRLSATSFLGRAVASTALAVGSPASAGATVPSSRLEPSPRVGSVPPSPTRPSLPVADVPNGIPASDNGPMSSSQTPSPRPLNAEPSAEPAMPPGFTPGDAGDSTMAVETPQIMVVAPEGESSDGPSHHINHDTTSSSLHDAPHGQANANEHAANVGDKGDAASGDQIAQMKRAAMTDEGSATDPLRAQ